MPLWSRKEFQAVGADAAFVATSFHTVFFSVSGTESCASSCSSVGLQTPFRGQAIALNDHRREDYEIKIHMSLKSRLSFSGQQRYLTRSHRVPDIW
jgi:hypothetical protein